MYISQKTTKGMAFMDHERQFVTIMVDELIDSGWELTSGYYRDGLVYAKDDERVNDAEQIELTKEGEIQETKTA